MAKNSDGTFDFGIGENDRQAKNLESRLKMEANSTAWISFAWWSLNEDGTIDWDAKTPKFRGADRHYVEKKGYFLNGGRPEVAKILGSAPQTRVVTIVVKWPTSKSGKLDKDELVDGLFEVVFWVFDPKKYDAFSSLNAEFPFANNDLLIKCTNSDFQHMEFQPKPGNLLRKLSEDPKGKAHFATIMADVERKAVQATDELGRMHTLDELRALMAGKPISRNGAAMVSATADGDVDDAIDDALEL